MERCLLFKQWCAYWLEIFMFSSCIIMMNFSLVESFSKFSSLVKIVLINSRLNSSFGQSKRKCASSSTLSLHSTQNLLSAGTPCHRKIYSCSGKIPHPNFEKVDRIILFLNSKTYGSRPKLVLNNLYVLSLSFTWISLCQVLQNLSWKSTQAEFMLKFWRLSNVSGCRKVVNRCLIFCDQLFLNIDLPHRKILCVNRVSGILINLFHRRIISMWRLTLPVVRPMSPATTKFGACLWTPWKMRMARYCTVSILGISGYPQTPEL